MKNIGRVLKEHGWNSHYLSVYPSRFSRDLFAPQRRIWNGLRIEYLCIGEKYPRRYLDRLSQLLSGHLGLLIFVLFRSKRYDALYFYNPRFTDTLCAMLFCRLLGRKVIVDQTELHSTRNNSWVHRLEERLVARYASELMVISTNMRSHFQNYRDKVHLWPIMVNIDRFRMDRVEEKGLMGYIGSFGKKDGIDLLLDALAIAVRLRPQLRLRLIGYNSDPERLMSQVLDRDLEPFVEMTGMVEYVQVPWLLLECDTLIMNRDSSEYATYGYPIKLGEYFACAKPILMSTGGGFSNDFTDGDQVLMYEVDNAQSLAERMVYRYDNAGESEAIAKRGYHYACDHFDANKLGLYLVNLLESIT